MIARTSSCSLNGIEAFVVDVEADISFGLPCFQMVGLAEASVRESKERVRSAINNSGYTFPMDRLVVNLAPADVQKTGSGLDLPVAVAILAASGLIPASVMAACLVVGELSLDGRVRPVRGVLPVALLAREKGFRTVVVPRENADEAALVSGIQVLPVTRLSEMVDHFAGHAPLIPHVRDQKIPDSEVTAGSGEDLSDIQGQAHARRALEIAAAGMHHLLMTGPPGSGKSMLARRLPTILPALSFEEALEVARVYSVIGAWDARESRMGERPFRSPHHTISDSGLVGGGPRPIPGEISLAHHGVLFLDELPEFRKNVLEVLRQPLENGAVTIVRAGIKAVFPCQFMLVGAMNPCSCGFYGDPDHACTCPPPRMRAYRAKVSGPLLDRLDLQVSVPRVAFADLLRQERPESSAPVRDRVAGARQIQQKRFRSAPVFCNARMGVRDIRRWCRLDAGGESLLSLAASAAGLSARACHSVLKVARTIADLDQSPDIRVPHLAEAVQYRGFDRDGTREENL